MEDTQIQSVGRRKSAVARLTMRPGTGLWRINGRELDEYFPMHRHREVVERPLGVVSAEGTYDLMIRVRGGGPTGQAGAVQLAVARGWMSADHRNWFHADLPFYWTDFREDQFPKPLAPLQAQRTGPVTRAELASRLYASH